MIRRREGGAAVVTMTRADLLLGIATIVVAFLLGVVLGAAWL
jgi:hypothetical protein